MATAPLFIADLTTLKSKLRLSGIAAASDADDIVNEAILLVRAGFYRELGAAQVTATLALSFTETPTTNDQILRAVANSTEVKWVRVELMRMLPMAFMDGNADQAQIFQDEALFRDASARQLDQERIRLETEIQQNLDLLRGSEELATESTIRIDTVAPDCPSPLPGDTRLPVHVKNALFPRRCL